MSTLKKFVVFLKCLISFVLLRNFDNNNNNKKKKKKKKKSICDNKIIIIIIGHRLEDSGALAYFGKGKTVPPSRSLE